MGATPFDGGTTFRVWAPNASSVAVRLREDDARRVPLAREANGLWSADVAGVRAGDVFEIILRTADGELPPRVEPYTRVVVNRGDRAIASVVYDEEAFDWGPGAYRTSGWTEMVIYELHVGSFAPQPGRDVGTFDDVTAKLPYLEALGVNAVELMPIVEFAGNRSWGYNPGVPFSVDEAYGGPDALKRFVRAAHARGIAVLLDVVYNHFGPDDSILWQFDGSGPGWEGGAYFYGERFPGDPRAQTPWGSRPDYGRPGVRRYLRDNALSWLQDYRLDGLRLDATAYIRMATGAGDAGPDIPDGWRLLQEINDGVDAAQPWKLIVAEDLRGNEWITRPTVGGGAGFDAQWDAQFAPRVRETVVASNDSERSMATIRALLERRDGPTAFDRVVYTESHDADGNGRTRVPAEIDPAAPDSWWAKKRSTLAAALVMTAPGIPMLFQGQEMLDGQAFVQPAPTLNWSGTDRHAGIVVLYRDLIRLRRDWFDHTRGLRGEGLNVFHVNDDDKVIAYHRWDDGGPGDDVVVALNFANRSYDTYTIGFPKAGTWRVRCNTDWKGYDATFAGAPSFDVGTIASPRDGLGFCGSVGIGAYTAIILSQDRQ